MKGWKVELDCHYNLPDNYEEVKKIEQYDHLNCQIVRKQFKLTLNKENCLRLADLDFLLNIHYQMKTYQYTQLYRFQVLQIIRLIAQHLLIIKENELVNNNLSLQNIWIRFGEINLSTYYNTNLRIDQIYFVNYDCQQNQKDMDFQLIQEIFNQFAHNIQDKEAQIYITIMIKHIKDKDSLKQFIELISKSEVELKSTAGYNGQEDIQEFVKKMKNYQNNNIEEEQDIQQKQDQGQNIRFDDCDNQNIQENKIEQQFEGITDKKIKRQQDKREDQSWGSWVSSLIGNPASNSQPDQRERQIQEQPTQKSTKSWTSWASGLIVNSVSNSYQLANSYYDTRYKYRDTCCGRTIQLHKKLWSNNKYNLNELVEKSEQLLLNCLYREQFKIFAQMFEKRSVSADDKSLSQIKMIENVFYQIFVNNMLKRFDQDIQKFENFTEEVDKVFRTEFKMEIHINLINTLYYFQDLWLQWLQDEIQDDPFKLYDLNFEVGRNKSMKKAQEFYKMEHRQKFVEEIEKLVNDLK